MANSCLNKVFSIKAHSFFYPLRSVKKITNSEVRSTVIQAAQFYNYSMRSNKKQISNVCRAGAHGNQCILCNEKLHFQFKRVFSATGLSFEKESRDISPEGKPLTQRQKLTRIFAAYGTTAVVFHTTISLASLGTCYMIVSSGIDMVALLEKVGIASKAGLQSTLTTGASTFVIAYACHKVFMPVRIFLTVTCTPIIVGKLRSIGILKQKAKQEEKNI